MRRRSNRAAWHRLRCLGLLLAATALPPLASGTANAATLRTFGTINGPTVTVADLWDDAGPAAARVLGPAPPPGERIVVPAAQLAAIARQFGVAWEPESPSVRAVLERAGIVIPRERVLAPLSLALNAAGAPVDLSLAAPGNGVECNDLVLPLIPPEVDPRVVVEQVSWDPSSGHFDGTIALQGHGMATLRLPVSGRVVAMADAVVTTRALSSTGVIAATDVAPARLPRERLRADALTSPDSAVGMRLRRPLGVDEPLLASELAPPEMVAKGAHVSIEISATGVAITASGQALAAGAIGDHIPVRNPASRAVLLAEVIGRDQVRVAPGSMPIHPPEAAVASADYSQAAP